MGIMEDVEALALVGGHVDEELLVGGEYPAAENENHKERNHQGKENHFLFPMVDCNPERSDGRVECRSRLRGSSEILP